MDNKTTTDLLLWVSVLIIILMIFLIPDKKFMPKETPAPEAPLTPAELEVFNLLKTVPGNSIWCISCRNVCGAGNVTRFRNLISQIKSEDAAAPGGMERILGTLIYRKIMQL